MLQSSNIAQFFFPIATANWSIIPQFTPMKVFSASWQSFTKDILSKFKLQKSLIIIPIKTSREAEEERPELFGISPYISILRPVHI